jgi:hypothetical protein
MVMMIEESWTLVGLMITGHGKFIKRPTAVFAIPITAHLLGHDGVRKRL